MRVRYEAEACNDENRRIEIERKLSKGKLNKKKFAKLQRYLGAGVCVTLIKDSVINTCDRKPKSLCKFTKCQSFYPFAIQIS